MITHALIRQLAELQKSEREDAWLALLEFLSAFGRPHVHAGLGIRKLAPHVFECRAGLRLRLVIRDKPEALEVQFIGTHDEIRRLNRDREW